jgi:hypothetical protein
MRNIIRDNYKFVGQAFSGHLFAWAAFIATVGIVLILIVLPSADMTVTSATVTTSRHRPSVQRSPQVVLTYKELTNFIAQLPATNCSVQDVLIWTNKAGDKTIGITKDGMVFLRVKF